MIKVFEVPEEQFIATFGKMFKTRIRHRLTATGLRRGINDFAPELFQQPHGRNAYLRIELIDITGYEQSYSQR